MKRLKELGVISVPWPQKMWPVTSDGHCTPHEKLGWRFSWPNHLDHELDVYLTDRLVQIPWNDDCPQDRIQLWEDLAAAEINYYAAKKLKEHDFDAAWASDLDWVRGQNCRLPISKWRYVVWAAVRCGASEFLRSGKSMERARNAIKNEYLNRIRIVQTGASHLGTFVPSGPYPYSLLAQVLTECVLPVKQDYWTEEPSQWLSWQ